MNNDQVKRRAVDQVTASTFTRVNGLIMRTIIMLFNIRWFKASELKAAMANRDVGEDDICEALDYFEGQKYIEVREIATKEAVRLSDFYIDDVEFKLAPQGKLVALSIKKDDGIDL